jgi:pimeloyl-ACP methyl ester carboxylesterase
MDLICMDCIVHIHGMGGNIYLNSFYPEMHKTFPEHGWSFLAGELKGSASANDLNTKNGIQTKGNAFERFEECIDDIDAWITEATNLGHENIWLQAHSLGPSKTAYYINETKDPRVKGLIFLCPADMMGLALEPGTKPQHERLLLEAKALVVQDKGKQLLSEKLWNEYMLSAGTYVNFFGENSKTGIFNFFDSSLGWNVINSITLPVLGITGTNDGAIAPVKNPKDAMKQLEEELKNSPRKKTIVYDGAHHDLVGFADKTVKDILDFVS